jgi:hypothetical protein
MTRNWNTLNARHRFEIGDEVVGDEHITGTIMGTTDVPQPRIPGYAETLREYLIRTETGEIFLYAGESNLRLVRKGLGDAGPPRPEVLDELDQDLKNRPLVGIRF